MKRRDFLKSLGAAMGTVMAAPLLAKVGDSPEVAAPKSADSHLFDGDIDQFSVWDRPLTTDEVSELYDSGEPMRASYWSGGEWHHALFIYEVDTKQTQLWIDGVKETDSELQIKEAPAFGLYFESEPVVTWSAPKNMIGDVGTTMSVWYKPNDPSKTVVTAEPSRSQDIDQEEATRVYNQGAKSYEQIMDTDLSKGLRYWYNFGSSVP